MPTPSLAAGDHDCQVEVGERTRGYLLHVPATERPADGWPVVLCFHGGGANPRQMIEFTGLNDAADKHGFVVVYPAGTGIIKSALTWNAGNCCGRALRDKVDEIAFITALLKDLGERVTIDEQRLYATGMSNGAMMAYLVADKLSERFAAIAPVGGPIGSETCAPSRPVPVMHFHGTADEYVSYTGGIGRRSVSKTNFYSVEHSLAQWIRANHANATPEVEELPVIVNDGTRVTRSTYAAKDKAGADVIHYKIEGMGHTWPGRESRFTALGRTSKNVDATEVMWQFFARHRREPVEGKK
jgi:polyhydroxybutyrate depolymerase